MSESVLFLRKLFTVISAFKQPHMKKSGGAKSEKHDDHSKAPKALSIFYLFTA